MKSPATARPADGRVDLDESRVDRRRTNECVRVTEEGSDQGETGPRDRRIALEIKGSEQRIIDREPMNHVCRAEAGIFCVGRTGKRGAAGIRSAVNDTMTGIGVVLVIGIGIGIVLVLVRRLRMMSGGASVRLKGYRSGDQRRSNQRKQRFSPPRLFRSAAFIVHAHGTIR